ncbi:Major Facilitator Superfamily (MFS) [Phytophthora cinnamomi]|uniref:Major Facilitator Superfamily (MFS) n=1 Tax=Phytophthora cinnamomi TaxID=4785 RepID=UPI00355A8EB2|nr:Major Facilitator Superfamily (MFS) [Phytophthora cinnamomi]
MGNVCCGSGNAEMLARQELLKEGNDFKKKSSFLGVLSRTENVYLQLNPAATKLMWRQTPGPSTLEELPIHRIGKVCPMGRLDLVLLGQNGQKLLELTAGTTSVRDLWVQTLEELYLPGQAEQSESDAKSLKEQLEKQKEKQKEQYWKDRTEELEQRRLDAEKRKKKIGVIGMKYTAQAMARR